ncbi:hypothetical protein [Nocardia arizonensis]|uniref:hypothetical protein n=1 Tax=Nocardia arizonensis TaxID=1141647 RepID=UPI0006D1C5E8|nr:hypothetical protein [Nocardia arizonensis]
MTEIHIGTAEATLVIAPPGAPTVLDDASGAEVLVLEVSGGHLTWNLLAAERIPAAVLDDADAAGDWLWAVYGERAAVAAADRRDGDHPAEPALPDLLGHAWRLAYAHWAARWWPASTIDGIAALDPYLLESEIAALTEQCDLLVDGADASVPDLGATVAAARQEDYALAASGGREGSGLTLARGVGGWDWANCPPGLVDASERAVSWEMSREFGATLVTVRAAAAPRLDAPVPPHLRPRAVLDADRPDALAAEIDLSLIGDTWIGAATVSTDSIATVDLRVPGVGSPEGRDDAGTRQRIREFAAARLDRAARDPGTGFDAPLSAEIAAATDTDF